MEAEQYEASIAVPKLFNLKHGVAVYCTGAQLVQIVQRLSGTVSHTVQRIVCHKYTDPRFLFQNFGKAAQQGSATGKIDPVIHNIGR